LAPVGSAGGFDLGPDDGGQLAVGFDAAGKRQRVKRKGRTKAQVKDKLRSPRRRSATTGRSPITT
jgi:hypothetical protein